VWASVASRECVEPVTGHGVLRPAFEQMVCTSLAAASAYFTIASYAVRAGDRVRAGDPIARIVQPLAAVRVDQHRQMLHLLQAQLADARAAALGAPGEAAALRIEAAEQRLAQARVEVACAERGLGIDLCSPMDGLVAELPAVPASTQHEVVPVARIVQLDPLRLEVAVPLGSAMPASRTPLEVAVGPVRARAVARGLAADADPSGRVRLVLEVPNADGALVAGLAASVRLGIGEWRGLFVPRSAVRDTPAGPIVQVEGERSHPVQVVWRGDEEIAILGLPEGTAVTCEA
jgi:membrane fusion protein (multidrug efflux system)